MDIDEVVRIAEAIATRARVDIYGIGGSAVMAREMQLRLYRIGINAHHWGEVHDGLTSAALLDEDSVAIAISNTGRTVETIEMLAQAKSSGAFTLAITSNADSPLAALADVHLVTVAPDVYLQPDDLSAKHAQLFALDLLYLIVAQRNFPRTATTLAASAAAVAPHRRAPTRDRRPTRGRRTARPTPRAGR
jgi:DNA-binding MurR/RpiR family transcriptional regulator